MVSPRAVGPPDDSGRPFWDELVYRYQMGVQYVTWMRETWDTLQPYVGARRFAEVKAKLATHETDAATWRDPLVSYWREFSARDIPLDGGPLSAKIVVGGKLRRRLRPGRAAYTIPVAAGASPQITAFSRPTRRRATRSSRQASGVPGQAVVKVTKDDFFGPLVKNYVFNLVPDTTLAACGSTASRSSRTRRPSPRCCRRARHDRQGRGDRDRSRRGGRRRAGDDVAGQAKVTVTNGGASTVYPVDLDLANAGSDEFDGAARPPVAARAPGRRARAGGERCAAHHVAERRPPGQRQHRQEPRAAERQRRLDGRVQARLLAPADDQQRAGRDHRLFQRQQLREAGLGDVGVHPGDQQAPRRRDPRAERHRDDAADHGRRRPADRRRRRRDLAAAGKLGGTYKAYYSATAASGASWARRR